MSMMEIMDRLVMSEASNGSAGGTEYPAVRKQAHQQYAIEVKRRIDLVQWKMICPGAPG